MHKKVVAVGRGLLSDPATVFILVVSCLVFILFSVGTYASLKQAKATHDALCALKNARIIQVDRSQEFLLLSKEERAEKYGQAFADIPDEAIQQGIADNRAVIAALRKLSCPQPPPH